jgi:hypothetical protein
MREQLIKLAQAASVGMREQLKTNLRRSSMPAL